MDKIILYPIFSSTKISENYSKKSFVKGAWKTQSRTKIPVLKDLTLYWVIIFISYFCFNKFLQT